MTAKTTLLRSKLLIGASIGSMLLAGVAEAQSGRGRGGASVDPADAAIRAAQEQAARQAQSNAASQRAIQSFRRAAEGRAAMQQVQAAARAAAKAAQNNVPNGLGQGGLQVANGVPLDPSLWVGANGPTQATGADGRTVVTVGQTESKAILTWDSFNVGRETDLVFNQKGNADWVALNRVNAGTDPTKILGNIKADGSVYIINRNGIIFGGASQVNTRNLIASTADIATDQFLNRGIYSQLAGANYVPSFTAAGGAVTVEAGAQITTHSPKSVTAGGGFVLLMGSEVTNAGSIATPRGQTALSAGDDFIIRRGYGTTENLYSTTRGNEVRGLINADSTSGTVTNIGQIEAAQGDITLAGRTIRQDGVMVATTGVNQRGTIHLLNSASDAEGSVTLGKNSLTLILPELDSKDTALNSQRDALIAESEKANLLRGSTITGGFDDRSLQADRLDQSRVEIVTGGNVVFEGGSQTMVNGGQVAVQANTGRITVKDGANIDVSGIMGVALDMASNSIRVNVQGNELRDSPSNREEAYLKNQNVWVDVRDLILLPDGTGGYKGDRWYTPGGLLEVGGHLANTAHGIGEWSAVGGSITLAASEVVAERGAVFDISGGSIDYAAGYVRSSLMMGEDGRMYDLRNAPAGMKFVGVGNAFMVKHDRWGSQYNEVYSNRLFGRGTTMRWEDGYTVGRDAGRLILSAPTVVMEANILAGVINGDRQTQARANGVTDGYQLGQHTVAQAGSLVLGRYGLSTAQGLSDVDVRIGDVADATPDLATGEALPEVRTGTAWFDATRLNEAGLGGIKLETRGSISVESDLTLADGGSVALVAPTIDIAADITARSGSISATNFFVGGTGQGNADALLDTDGGALITLREGATLDARGLWVNTTLNSGDANKLGLLDGGDVYLASTHDLVLEKGSLIDVSSGAAQLEQGATRGGRGGDVTLIADLETEFTRTANGLLRLDGQIAAFGVSGGGTLRVESGTAISIGGKLLETDGVLAAGAAAPVDVVLMEDYAVGKGDILPIAYSYSVNIALPGEKVPAGGASGIVGQVGGGYLLGVDWTLPNLGAQYSIGVLGIDVPGLGIVDGQVIVSSAGRSQYYYYDGQNEHFIDIPHIPAGTRISLRGGTVWAGWVVDPLVFPNGLRVPAYTNTVKAGDPSPIDMTVRKGTVLSAGTTLPRPIAIATNAELKTGLFQSGFSSYDITARNGVVVTDGTKLDVSMPAYRLTNAAASTATGANPADALELWTPPLYQEDPVNGVLTQRGGASLTLRSVRTNAATNVVGGGGAVIIGSDASVTVDPGKSIDLRGSDIRVDGRLDAWGGAITLDVPSIYALNDTGSPDPGLIWIGETAVLDVAARAATARDQHGRVYGLVADGGTISIGGALDWEETGEAFGPNAFVVIRSGALLDASGASATLDIPTGGPDTSARPVALASDGGSIIVKSNNGLYLDGTLRAAAGGEGAAGGTLALALISPNYARPATSGAVLSPREFVLAQTQGDSLLPGDIDAAAAPGLLKTGTAHLGVDRIAAGGFDNLSLLVDGPLSFDGNVSLDLGQSLRLYTAALAMAEGAASNSKVSLNAPYVRLAGVTRFAAEGSTLPTVGWANGVSQQESEAQFHVEAKLIDIRDTVGFGASGIDAATNLAMDRRGFATVDLASTGDLRLLRGRWRGGSSAPLVTGLETAGDIILTAAQIYPATDASARVVAGYQGPGSPFAEGTSLTIRRAVEGDVAVPYSAFGRLTLAAETINQGGIVRAPAGSLGLGSLDSFALADSVNLLAGSLTSVSGAGLVMPYGGTVDGIAYSYDGREIVLSTGGIFGRISSTINLGAAHVVTESGSTLDLSGGGELTGAGFVSGRGGSVNVLNTPLANASPGYGSSSAGNAVYAIVPSSGAAYAPVAAEAGAGSPLVGQQITVPEGVPDLPAGTYTLMPSNYALLPGAFRVEIGAGDQAGLRGVTALGNGSYVAAGTLGIANTAIREALPNQVIITPGKTARTHSAYNETSYNSFVRADASRIGVPRATVTSDAGTLGIALFKNADHGAREALSIAGDVRLNPEAKSDGYGGTVAVGGLSEVLAAGQNPTEGMDGVSVRAGALNALNAPRLLLNASLSRTYGQAGRYAVIDGGGSLIVRSGAEIMAGEVILGGGRRDLGDGSYADGALVIEEGAAIVAKAGGPRTFDSSDGYVFSAEGALVVSNGWFNLLLSDPPSDFGGGTGVNIRIGACVTDACDTPARLVSNGTIAIATNRALTIEDNVAYGTKNLVLGVASVNLGENASIDAADAAGHLPDGLVLNQAKLAELLAGNTATGAPALETLVLNARDAVNVYGSVDLDASSLERVVFGAPAIYGYGAAGDVAKIRAGEFIWTGAEDVPGAPVAALLGHGALDIAAKSILFGYGPNTQPASTAVDDRLALGFSKVSLTASERISASGKSSLTVHETRGDYVTGEGWRYAGGDLSITAPIVTGAAGSKFTVSAGGDVTIGAPAGTSAAATSNALGAQLAIAGRNVTIDTAIVLPSGRLTLTAIDDIRLENGARIDLSGREITMFDVKKYSWGGDLVLASTGGDISTAAGSIVDLSAKNNRGGTMTVTALGTGAGHVDLAGAILGSASGQYDAGGTLVPYDAAELTVRGQTLADFAGLNSRLNTGGVFGARRFQIKQGDLVVGDGVKARDLQIVLDGGDLTVNGKIDASGYQVGSIRLAAMGDLTINGTLDAHGTGLRVDSYGKIIDSPNRAIVDLTSRAGTLTLADSAVIDLRSGTDVAAGSGTGQNDGVGRGTLDLNAARIGADDVAINVLGTLDARGAKTIAVNAFRSYDDAPLADLPDVSGERPQLITQAYLDTIDSHSQTFIDAALGNGALGNRLSGLGAYHLRPGVEIVSNATTNPNGGLTITGDIDLSGYRYGPDANRIDPARRGYGEPGVLVFRAAGDLNIHGSINDGFAPPSATPDDNGWVLSEGNLDPFTQQLTPTSLGGDIVIPIDGVVLDTGTTFQAGVTLNYDVPVGEITLPSGTVLPIDAVLTADTSLAAGTVVAANIYNADGGIAYAAGTVLRDGAALTAGMKLGAGTSLRADTAVAALTWPKGVKLPVAMALAGQLTLARGSLIPSMTRVELVGNTPIELRPASDGFQGRNWAVAPMLGEGATSWDLQLVAGADLASSDRMALDVASDGQIRLADSHSVVKRVFEQLPGGVWYWSQENMGYGTPNTPVDDWALDPTYNICENEPGQCIQVSWIWSDGNMYGGTPGAPADDWALDPSYSICEQEPGQCDRIGGPGGVGPLIAINPVAPIFSVVRTGTGDLSLIAAGDVRMDSLYGVYTAGTATSSDPAYDQPRGALSDGSVLGPQSADYANALADYRAWYPDQGGNLLITAGGNLIGDMRHSGGEQGEAAGTSSGLVGNWLWRQGSGSAAVDEAISTAWWINFGTYARVDDKSPSTIEPVVPVGFTGFGTLGGGDVMIRVGGDAGKIDDRGLVGQSSGGMGRSQGLAVAVGSTGRVGAAGALTLTGGGDLDMRIAGALNPLGEVEERASKTGLSGNIVSLRGTTQLDASSIGVLRTLYRPSGAPANPIDPRGVNPFEQSSAQSLSGLMLMPGDSSVYLQTLGDMVIAGAGDATRGYQLNTSPFTLDGTPYAGGGNSWFTLWTDHSAINLTSAGGNMAPSKAAVIRNGNSSLMVDLADSWPATLRVSALGGNVYYGASAGETVVGYTRDVLAPSQSGELSVVAAGSIYGGQRSSDTGSPSRHALILSATGTPLPTPFDPAFVGGSGGSESEVISNLSLDGGVSDINSGANWNGVYSLFAFGPNTAATAPRRAADADPIRIYAAGGDIVGLSTGETRPFLAQGGRTLLTWHSAGAPLHMLAGRDIVSSGTFGVTDFGLEGYPNLIVHSNTTDVSLVSAGRDILYANFEIAGPGVLEVTAGRNILQEDKGNFTSIGPIAIGDTRPGASIALMAGMGSGVDWNAIRTRYLDPSKLADPERPLADQPGMAVKVYTKELTDWLGERYDFAGTDAEALTYFDGLAPEQQRVFLRQVYYAETRDAGREYNDPDSSRFASYLRGREMIATLFPDKDKDGKTITRTGDIIMFGGSGVRTNFGGDIEMMAPGGQIVVGVQGEVPPASSGIITQGQGDIRLFSEKSLLLGLSRVMTTFGGSIFAWSEEGDINAGRGSKTSVLFTPPLRTYDNYGNVALAPQVPSSGAGIATLNPIPEVAPGDIDLIAPLGTIDAGEAGIRVSGNVNLAALQVINAANIQVQGDAKGIPLPPVVNTGALTAASSATSSVVAEATRLAERARPMVRSDIPSLVDVRFLGFGE